MSERAPFGDDDVLIVVDIQNDFCPGGALAVPHGDGLAFDFRVRYSAEDARRERL